MFSARLNVSAPCGVTLWLPIRARTTIQFYDRSVPNTIQQSHTQYAVLHISLVKLEFELLSFCQTQKYWETKFDYLHTTVILCYFIQSLKAMNQPFHILTPSFTQFSKKVINSHYCSHFIALIQSYEQKYIQIPPWFCHDWTVTTTVPSIKPVVQLPLMGWID